MSRALIAAIFGSILFSSACCAEPTTKPATEPSSEVDAKLRYDIAVKNAHDAYIKSLVAADSEYVKGLNIILAKTMAKGPSQITEAERINLIKTSATKAMQEHINSLVLPNPMRPNEDAMHWLIGTQWDFLGTIISYQDHKFTCSAYKADTSWEVIDDHTIRQYDADKNPGTIVTFTSDHNHVLWVYRNNDASTRDVQFGRIRKVTQ